MLITFSCPAYADITMFGDVAIKLLKLMGHSGQIPSALLADDVPEALIKLETAIETENQQQSVLDISASQDDEPVITLSKRALPLRELLTAAAKSKSNVMWTGTGK